MSAPDPVSREQRVQDWRDEWKRDPQNAAYLAADTAAALEAERERRGVAEAECSDLMNRLSQADENTGLARERVRELEESVRVVDEASQRWERAAQEAYAALEAERERVRRLQATAVRLDGEIRQRDERIAELAEGYDQALGALERAHARLLAERDERIAALEAVRIVPSLEELANETVRAMPRRYLPREERP